MAGTILTPNAIWKNFKTDGKIGAEVISEKKSGGIVFSNLLIEGRKVKDGVVEIFGTIAKKAQLSVAPAILVLCDLNETVDETLITDLANRGYTVLAIDVAGQAEGKENFTVYPESLSHARYENVKDDLLTIKGDVRNTCWYEWTAAARIALQYLKNQPQVTDVGAIGIGEAATVLWQVAGTDQNLSCAVFAFNAGWRGYRGIQKFGGMVEPQFSDNMYKFIAGVEPQAYAMHVKCPTLMLSATNSKTYDVDRAFDTVSRIGEGVYKAVNYSVNHTRRISDEAYNTATLFLEEFLIKGAKENCNLPKESEIKCEISDGEIVLEVIPDENGLKEVCIYASEQMTDSAFRSWNKVSSYKKTDGVYKFKYNPYPESGIVVAFAKCVYKNGFAINSKIVAKKFEAKEVKPLYKSNIIYSSRIKDAESCFSTTGRTMQSFVDFGGKCNVKVKKGPMGIEGVTCQGGLRSFMVGTDKNRPMDGAMLMLDVYAKNQSQLEVRLIEDYFGQRTEYIATVNILGGDVWHNVQLEANRFKTVEGRSLKSYERISVLEINVLGADYLINNALWV